MLMDSGCLVDKWFKIVVNLVGVRKFMQVCCIKIGVWSMEVQMEVKWRVYVCFVRSLSCLHLEVKDEFIFFFVVVH